MDGRSMGGRSLKLGKPLIMQQAQPIIEILTQESKKYHRIYVASIHPDVSEVDLRSVFGEFGKIRKVEMARGQRLVFIMKSFQCFLFRGFAYIEFDTASAVKQAIEGMNGVTLGGQILRVSI
jgi:poly(U)-binding-splicing factor PUF60